MPEGASEFFHRGKKYRIEVRTLHGNEQGDSIDDNLHLQIYKRAWSASTDNYFFIAMNKKSGMVR
jgi:hypothetical protein